MRKLFTAFTAMAIALSAVSCDDLNLDGDVVVEGEDQSYEETTTVTTYEVSGNVTVALGDVVSYEASDKIVLATFYNSNDTSTATITMSEMKFAEAMPLSLDLMFSDIAKSSIGDYYYAATITPTAPDGEPITYVTVTRFVVVDGDEGILIKFNCLYGNATYSVTFTAGSIVDEGQGDLEEDLTTDDDDDDDDDNEVQTPSITATEYSGEMNVAQADSVLYTDSDATLYAAFDEATSSVDVTLAGVKFSAYMPVTLDLTFSDVAYDSASESYYAATITPTDADGAEMTSVAISDFTLSLNSDMLIEVSFVCTYGGSDYTITFAEYATPSIYPSYSFEGEIEVAKDDVVSYTDSATVVEYTKGDNTVSVVLPSVKFSAYMQSTIYMAINDVEYEEDLGYYYIDEITPLDADGEELSSVVISEFMLYEENSYTVAISFICTYGGSDYEISYYAELKRESVI